MEHEDATTLVDHLARSGDAELPGLIRDHAPALLSSNGSLLRPLLPRLRTLNGESDPWVLLVTGFARHDADFADREATDMVEEALKLFRHSEDGRGEGFALYTLGNQAVGRGDLTLAAELWNAGRALLGPESAAYAHALCNSSLGAYSLGDLHTALAIAEHGLAVSIDGGLHRSSGTASVYIAAFNLWTGDFARVETAVDLARQSFQEVADPAERYEWPVGLALLGVLAALRGDAISADESFQEALKAAEVVDAGWVQAMVYVLRAEHTSGWHPHRSLADAQLARDILDAHNEVWWTGEARIATAVALTECESDRAAVHVFEEALASGTLIPLEEARCSLLLGETLLRTGEVGRAAELVTGAQASLEASGAFFWAARACIAAARLDTSSSVRHWQRARGLAGPDVAFERLFLGSAPFRVQMLGPPRILVDGDEISFPSRHARLVVLALAAAGSSGLSAETLHTWLWPDADRITGGRRLKTAVWQARRALGPAAGRLRRSGARLTLSLTAGECDLTDAIADAESILASGSASPQALAEASLKLSRAITGGEDFSEWVTDLQDRVDALRYRLALASTPSG